MESVIYFNNFTIFGSIEISYYNLFHVQINAIFNY